MEVLQKLPESVKAQQNDNHDLTTTTVDRNHEAIEKPVNDYSLEAEKVHCDVLFTLDETHEVIPSEKSLISVVTQSGNDNKKNATVLCWSCGKEIAKYKCPKCFIQTCSVACVKIHKKSKNCDGVRLKTEYVAKENYKGSDLLSDYRFLEEVNRVACKNDRNKLPYSGVTRSMKLQIGKAAASGISLKLLPPNFSRRKKNSTFYCYKQKGFLWHVEWIFFNCDITLSNKRFPDTIPLLEGASRFFNPKRENSIAYDPRLDIYTGRTDLKFFMKKEGLPANVTIYYQLDGSRTLRSLLPGKTIIEFPRIFVLLPEKSSEFEKYLLPS